MYASTVTIQEFGDSHRMWARRLLSDRWGSSSIVSRGRIHNADALPGFVATADGHPKGLITYHIEKDQCEIVSLDSLAEGSGIGTALLNAVLDVARSSGCVRTWLITTNDNTPALRFWQRRGFEMIALHRGAVGESRKLKPEIPHLGSTGIPIRDEIELEVCL